MTEENQSLRDLAVSLGAARPLGMEDIPNLRGMRAKTLRRLMWQASTKLLSPWRKEVVLPDGRICHPTKGFRGGPSATGLPLAIEMQYQKAHDMHHGDDPSVSLGDIEKVLNAAEKAERSWRRRLAALFFTRRPRSLSPGQTMVERMTNWQRTLYSRAVSPAELKRRGLTLNPKLQEQIARTCVTMPHWKSA